MELKDSLRRLRKARGITQEAAAEALGVSSQTIFREEYETRIQEFKASNRHA